MRIWDQIDPQTMCRQHLLGEHAELHGLWRVFEREQEGESKVGYAHHPETQRWRQHLLALRARHQLLAEEIIARGWNHRSPLAELQGEEDSSGESPPPLDDQLKSLQAKNCACTRSCL